MSDKQQRISPQDWMDEAVTKRTTAYTIARDVVEHIEDPANNLVGPETKFVFHLIDGRDSEGKVITRELGLWGYGFPMEGNNVDRNTIIVHLMDIHQMP